MHQINYNKMGKTIFISCILLVLCVTALQAIDLGCPLSSKMTSCSPKCKDDSECFGQKCCPNICNMKSCTTANQLSNTKDGYKNPISKTATGSYCGNVKCNSYEKCELDRSTKRQRCVRH